MFAQVIIQSKTRMINQIYTYAIGEELVDQAAVGLRVMVPFGSGNQPKLGIIIDLVLETNFSGIKSIIAILDEIPIINQEQIQLAMFMVNSCLADFSSAFQAVLPPGDWASIHEYFWSIGNQDGVDFDLHQYLNEKRSYQEILQFFSGRFRRKELMALVNENRLQHSYSLSQKASMKTEKTISLAINYKDIPIPNNALAQKRIIDYLIASGPVKQREILSQTNTTTGILAVLEGKGIIRINENRIYRDVLSDKILPYSKIQLNPEQQCAFSTITNSDDRQFLLHGVTGSGKTEIYLQLVEDTLSKGKEAIILVPEIALTPQTIQRFAGRFGNQVAVLHSKLSLNEKFDQWNLIQTGQVKIVVGARSAVFAPFQNLGLIVIDEEHELSYVSEKNPKYHAVDIALFRCQYHQSKLVQGSATPSVETYYQALVTKTPILKLKNRATQHPLPKIEIVDMRNELLSDNFSIFSRKLQEEIAVRLERREQVILFLNKRGHTSYVFCRKCGYVVRCDSCDISMTYHKEKNCLICHFCGRTARKPGGCPQCGSKAIKEFGAGTEKLEEETKLAFPAARVARMDADTTRKKSQYENMFQRINNQEVDILIGTQMITKGLDFPSVTLVGIIAADLSLHISDFRAHERTFQLLTQVSGRAGRGGAEGLVVLQTYQPDNYAIRAAQGHDYDAFFKEELKMRKLFQYPPFCRVISIQIAHKNRMACKEKSYELAHSLSNFMKEQNMKGISLIGPNPSVIEKINNFYRYQIILKVEGEISDIRDKLRIEIMEKNKRLDIKDFRIDVTIDPISFY